MLQQGTFEFFTLERELPCQDAGRHRWHGRNRRQEQVVVGGISQTAPLEQFRGKVECHSGYEQSDWEMNQHNMLRVFCQQYRFDVEWIHFSSSFASP